MRTLIGFLFAAAFAAASVSPAAAQSAPGWGYGFVPTPAQWNAAFAAKTDYNGPVCLVNGCQLTGELVTAAPTTATSGFRLLPGVSPTSPNNGDMWMTVTGLFIRVNGSTVGPLGTAACATCAVTNATNTFTFSQIISLNAATLPTALTGDVLQLGNADSTISRVDNIGFGATPIYTGRRADGTNASPTGVVSNDILAAFNAYGYYGAGWSATGAASVELIANQTWSVSAQGTHIDLKTTPNGSASSALAVVCRFENDGGVTCPATVTGGDKGPGTINTAGLFVNGVAASVGGGTVNVGTANQLAYYATSSSTVSGNANATITAGALTLGQAGSVVGSLSLANGTSGVLKIQPPTGALTGTLTVPNLTDTLAVLGSTQTFSGALTFSNTVNFTSVFDVNGNAVTWPNVATTVAALNITDQVLTGGTNVTPFSIGSVSSGTTTIDCGKSPLQWMVDTGASTIAVPANDSSCLVEIINGNGAGALTFSGFSGKTSLTSFSTTATSTATVTFTNSSANITWTANGLALNAPVYFTNSGGALPTNFSVGTIYYVVSTGTNTIQVSATPGGSAIVAGSAGSGTQTGTQPSVWDLSINRIDGNTLGIIVQVQ